MKKIKVKTPAKINLTLEILGKRPDSFHEIRSIMQAVSLFDYLNITLKPGSGKISLSGNSTLIPYDEKNIVYIALRLFLEYSGTKNLDIDIYIEKNIPVAAGLAGGSSNAAGTLRGVNEICGYPLGGEKLHSIASMLGSDVNFCLEGGTCLATSRGEKIERISAPGFKFVLVKPENLFIPAKEAYQRYSELNEKPKSGKKTTEMFYNDLEKAIIPAYPEIEEMKTLLLGIGCKKALMSGSGPSVFGVYDDDIDVSVLPGGYEVFKAASVLEYNELNE